MASTASKLSFPLSGSHAFHIFCDRHIFPILLHNVVTLTAIQYYVFDDCESSKLLRVNIDVNVRHGILVALSCLGILDILSYC